MKLFRNFELLEKMAATKGVVARFVVSLLRSRYFIISASIYLLLALILAPIVISHHKKIESIFKPEGSLFVRSPAPERAPPIQQPSISGKSPTAKQNVDGAAKSTLDASTMANARASAAARLTGNNADSAFVQPSVPIVASTFDTFSGKIGTDMGVTIDKAERQRIMDVKKFQEGWLVSSIGPGNSPGNGPGSGKSVRAKFTIFQAKYQDGDWNCNPNALYNMMLQIRAWSKDRIDAQIVPEVLDIGTDKIFTLKPPFVYLTGHKDFRLLDNEVKNLREYLNMGGAIWGDTALAGRHSRFDIAFRREMNRILPDRAFAVVPKDHELFDIFFVKIGLPSGMNYYHEPIEMITIGDKIAVIYTLNGYGHFWEARLNRDGKIQYALVNLSERGKKPSWQYVHGPHVSHNESSIIYRNINDETTRNAYKFGINVVVHLLTRYQRDIMLLPKELPTAPDMKNRTSRAPGTGTNASETATNAPSDEETSDKASKPGAKRVTTTRSERNFKRP